MRILLASMLIGLAAQAWGQPVSGSMDVRWNEGAPDCAATPQEPVQVHAYEPQTFILRQSPCADSEANFIYLLVGSDRAVLIDTGGIADPDSMPLARTVMNLLPGPDDPGFPLVVAHSHGHGDHRKGDEQFASLPSVQVVPANSDGMRSFFGFDAWPDGVARLDLGGRTIHAIPAPGHHPDHLVFYDDRTGLLFTGDFLLPGRLLVDDIGAYRESARRVVDFLADRPVAHILGGHIELDAAGNLFPGGSRYRPNERRLELAREELLALPSALEDFNGFYARHANFVLSNPIHNLLALIAAAIAATVIAVWGVRRLLRRRRRSVEAPADRA